MSAEINGVANGFFVSQLQHSLEAKAYLQNRNINSETAIAFSVGYAPNSWQQLNQFLLKNGYSQKEIIDSGLIVEHTNGKTFDRFRNRIMFPFYNQDKHIIGFTGRGIDSETTPKYLNSPDTNLFKKSEVLFGTQHLTPSKQILLVEGQFDVLSLYQRNITPALAVSGTSFSKSQANIITSYTKRLFVCLDNDDAGKKATKNIIDTIDIPVKIVHLGIYKDPDEIVQKHINLFIQALSTAKTYTEHVIHHDPDIIRCMEYIDDKPEYSKILAKRFNIPEKTLKIDAQFIHSKD